MVKARLVAIVCWAMGAVSAHELSAQEFRAPETPQAVPGEFILMARSGSEALVPPMISRTGGTVVETLPLIGGAFLVMAPNTGTAGDWAEQLRRQPEVETLEPNWRQYAITVPNDPRYPEQWGLPKIKAPQAWNIKKESPTVVVAVIDTGIDYNHPDVQSNMWKNAKEIPGNGIDDDKNGVVDDVYGANFVAATTGNPWDDHSHGTHVAGIVSAVTNNSVGIAGTSWKTQLMAVKFLSSNGSGSTAGAIKAIDYAVRMGAHVMNNSWGGGGFSTALKTAIEVAQSRGIVFTAAAGNFGKDNDANPFYPASYDVSNIISVLATGTDDKRANFSHWGKTSVDIGAPGVSILSTVPKSGYASFSGTSMATPFVSGASALVKSKHPTWKAEQIKKRLMDTVDKAPDLGNIIASGGRLNLEKAIQ